MIVLCIDLKSFYASCECISRNANPFKTALVVADTSRGPGSVVLAVSPLLKSLGVPSRGRIKDLPDNLNIIYAKPRMQLYIDISVKIVQIYLKYISIEDIHVYSIDEVFIDYTPYQKLYKKNPLEFAKMLLNEIKKETKITATCGIGHNMFMAKVAMDFEAKHNKNNLAYWNDDDIVNKLQKITNLTDVWGIGKHIEKRLNKLNIFTMKDLANVDSKILEKEFGIIGIELYNHAHGIDEAIIKEKQFYSKQKSIGFGQTLDDDYDEKQIQIVFKEMANELAYKLRKKNKIGRVIHLGIQYSYLEEEKGFSRQISMDRYTDDEKIILKSILFIFNKFYKKQKIRRVSLSIGDLIKKEFESIDIFTNQQSKEKEEIINKCLDEIKEKYQKNSVFKANSLLKDATYLKRNKLIGGHNAK